MKASLHHHPRAYHRLQSKISKGTCVGTLGLFVRLPHRVPFENQQELYRRGRLRSIHCGRKKDPWGISNRQALTSKEANKGCSTPLFSAAIQETESDSDAGLISRRFPQSPYIIKFIQNRTLVSLSQCLRPTNRTCIMLIWFKILK